MIVKGSALRLRGRGCILAPEQLYRAFSTSTACTSNKSSLPRIEKCPDPTCACATTPSGLDIDRSLPLDGTMAAYRHHAVVRTGVSDWPSKIEDDSRFPLVQTMRQRFGRGGRFHDPLNHTLLSTSSHPSSDPSVLLFPSFKALSSPSLHANAALETDPFTLGSKVDDMIAEYLFKPSKGHVRPAAEKQDDFSIEVSPIHHLAILICGHGGRDSRCGIMGPLLEGEFKRQLRRENWSVDEPDSSDKGAEPDGISDNSTESEERVATVELISHIGGHKFAGNVILYIPNNGSWQDHPLAGKGIWYGRVEPLHVEGILRETIGRGVIIQELFRGGISDGGDIIR